MSTPSEKLASSLETLHQLQRSGNIVIRSNDISRTHRERLLKNGFLQEVIKGWYIPARPDETAGESTAWYASLFDIRGKLPEAHHQIEKSGMRVYSLAAALVTCSEKSYIQHPTDMRTALSMIRDASEVRETDPFVAASPFQFTERPQTPITPYP